MQAAAAPDDPVLHALERALGAQYDILRLLGRGGMGAVYLGRERMLERPVAIKVLPPELAEDPDSRERFRREAKTAANLSHPNIVPLYSFGDVDGMLYFVMGYVQGESLAARIRREGRIGVEETRRIVSQLADALDFAHKQGVVHRDVKPDNVLLEDATGRPMLTDFGVAKAAASGSTLTEVGAVVGTPHYMSPEQAAGERTLDGRSDLYSLGVMAYAMLTGRLPFDGETFRDVILQHLSKEPTPIKALAPDVPEDVAGAVARCLVKDPAGRWVDGQAFKRALAAGDDDDLERWERDSLESIVPHLTPLAAATTYYGYHAYLFPGLRPPDEPWWVVPALLLGALTVIPAAFAIVRRMKGRSWNEIVGTAMCQPKGWPLWYPRRWRRKGDVWDRLPRFVRRARAWYVAGIAVGIGPFAVYAPLLWVSALNTLAPTPGWLVSLIFPLYALMMAGLVVPALAVRRWAKRRGLDPQVMVRVAFAPTGKLELWRKPRYAALLEAPQPERPRLAEPKSPEDHVRAIVETVKTLPGPLQEVGGRISSAARQLIDGLSDLEREIAALARDCESADVDGVRKRLQELGPTTADEGQARRQMRSLLESQLTLAEGLAGQLGEARERHAQMTDLLATLWLRVADLRAETARATFDEREVTGRIRAVLEEVEAHAVAQREVREDG